MSQPNCMRVIDRLVNVSQAHYHYEKSGSNEIHGSGEMIQHLRRLQLEIRNDKNKVSGYVVD